MGKSGSTIFSPEHTPPAISAGDITLLQSVGRFGLITAEQLTRLHAPTPHGLRSVQRRLKRLVDAGLLLRLRAHPTPRYGSAPHVFALSSSGRSWVAGLGTPVPDYFRPSEERDKAGNVLYLAHALSVVDVLISAAALARDTQEVSLSRLKTERELKHQPLRVAPDPTAPEHTVAVIPDAWFQLRVSGVGAYSIALELDRGTENISRWRTKTAALAAWATGPYQEAFDTDNLTIAVVAPTPARRDSLAEWILAELTNRGQPDLRGIFLITCVDPVSTPPEELFFLPHWYRPGASEPVSLMQPLPQQTKWEVSAEYQ